MEGEKRDRFWCDPGPIPRALILVGLLFSLPTLLKAGLTPEIVNYRLDDSTSHPPSLLSQTGLFQNILTKPRQVADSIFGYDVNAPGWFDGVIQERFVQVPFGDRIAPTDSAGYGFPDGTVFIKNFILENQAGDSTRLDYIETQFLVVTRFSEFAYYSPLTYRWRQDQSDADLVSRKRGMDTALNQFSGGETKALLWRFQSQVECTRCHFTESRGILSFITPQLNQPGHGPQGENQLQELTDHGILSVNPLAGKNKAFRWRSSADSTADLESRGRTYLAVNCSHCHGNAYNTHTSIGFDYFNPFSSPAYDSVSHDQGYLGRPKYGDSLYTQYLFAGNPSRSFLIRRLMARGTPDEPNEMQMPPLATYRLDTLGLGLLRDWVCSLGLPPTRPENCTLPDLSRETSGSALQGKPFANFHPGFADRPLLHDQILRMSPCRDCSVIQPQLFDINGRKIALISIGLGTFALERKPPLGLCLLKVGLSIILLQEIR